MKVTGVQTKVLIGLAAFFTQLVCSSGQAAVEPRHFTDDARKLSLTIKEKNWMFFGPQELNARGSLFVARSLHDKGLLTWRVDESTTADITARKYADKWLRDFPKFGLELINTRDVNYGILNGLEIEYKNPASNVKGRQLIVKNDKEIWIFTCSSETSKFRKIWFDCQKILATSRLTK